VRRLSFIVFSCLPFVAPAIAAAQTDSDGANAKLHVGPLALEPRFRLTNIGMDSNVFNASTNPTRAFTITFIPELGSYLRLSRARFTGKTSLDFVYFQKEQQQRSIDFSQEERMTLQMTRFTPYFGGGWVTSNQRPNDEIDARVHRTVTTFGAGVTTQLTPTVSLELNGAQSQFAFDDVTFDGVSLSTVLDRTSRTGSAKLAVQVTPLTTFVVKSGYSEDRFPTASDRDSNSTSATVGVDLKRSALISGTANVGIKWFQPRDSELPAYTGLVADVGLSYLWRDSTQIATKVARDTEYSFEIDQPYFVTTTVGFTVTQMVIGRVDAVLRATASTFAYRSLADAVGVTPGRDDRLTSLGVGSGYRLSDGARIGFDVSYDRRMSVVVGRSYQGFRFGGSFIYGY